MDRKRQLPWGFILLTLSSLSAMILLSRVDSEWTLFLNRHRVDGWAEFMRRTVFQSGAFGGSDPGILLMLGPTIAYFFAYPKSRFPSLYRYRAYLGFIFFSSLVTGLGLVHSIKWMVGRARPYLVMDEGMAYSHWFEFGPLHVSNGIFFGSFPSGHTATAILMITFAYILAADRAHPLRIRILGWFWGAGVVIYTTLMIIGRSMSFHHWLSDSVGIALMDWIAIHAIYFWILKIPRQVKYYRSNGRYPPLARYWEIQLLWRLLIITLAVMAVVIGIKAVIFGDAPFLILLLIPALPTIYFMGKSLIYTYTTLFSAM